MKVVKKFEEMEEKTERYMFFSNLRTIKKAVDHLLEMDDDELDEILKEHDWACDHIATSADDIEEVYHFLYYEGAYRLKNHSDEEKEED